MANCHCLSGLSVQCTGRCGSIECLFLNHWTIRRPLAGRDQKAVPDWASTWGLPYSLSFQDARCRLRLIRSVFSSALRLIGPDLCSSWKQNLSYSQVGLEKNRSWNWIASLDCLFHRSRAIATATRSAECHHRDWMAKFGACLLHEPRSRMI